MGIRNLVQASQFSDSSFGVNTGLLKSAPANTAMFGTTLDTAQYGQAEELYRATRHTCEECGKRCQTKFALSMHKRVHSGEKPYACDICGLRFNVKGNMRRHKLTHLSLQ